ncbi:MAG TPA: hypothetical protein VFR81_01275 [Longimicrobium sp.]|nr:hypothetical protein [Longimicrobium sp.]
MNKLPESVKRDIRIEYERTGAVTPALWMEIAPEHTQEIEDYIRKLTGSFDPSSESPPEMWSKELDARIDKAIDQQMDRIRAKYVEKLGRAVEAERARRPASTQIIENIKEKRAAVYAWATEIIGRQRTAVEMDLHKGLYALEWWHRTGLFSGFIAYKFGPFDPEFSKDARKWSLDRRWVERQGRLAIVPGPRVERGRNLAEEFLGDTETAERFLEYLSRFDEWELETLTTVHWAAERHILPEGKLITMNTVKEAIPREELWKDKLGRSNFTDAKIREALSRLVALHMLPADKVQRG